MMEAANDDEPLTFTRIGLAAALVLNRLRNETRIRSLQADEKQDEDRDRNTDRGSADHEHGSDHGAYVEKRLKETVAFERRAAGDGPARKRRERG